MLPGRNALQFRECCIVQWDPLQAEAAANIRDEMHSLRHYLNEFMACVPLAAGKESDQSRLQRDSLEPLS